MYTTIGISKRKPGERHDPRLLPMCAEINNDGKVYEINGALEPGALVGTLRKVGETPGKGEFRGDVLELLEVTLPDDRTVVPATRWKSPTKSYTVCQNFNYKAKRP